MRRCLNIAVVSVCVLASRSALAAEPESSPPCVPGKIEEVTFYRGQALVTRVVPLGGAKGGQEIVVGPLPEQIAHQSLFAEGADGVEIRAVRFRCRPVGEEPREEVRKLDEAIESFNEQLQAVERSRQLVHRENSYLDGMDNFVLPTMKTDLARGVLDAAVMEKLVELSFSRRETLANRIGELDKEAKEINKQLQLLQRKRAELTTGARNAVREALVFVDQAAEGKSSFRLSYLVNACAWSPSYTIRADKDGKQVAVECNAVISQMTGEDWSGVRLTLSTASPALSAAGPGLAPLPIALAQVGQVEAMARNASEISARARRLQEQKAEIAQQARNVFDFDARLGSSWLLNAAAGEYQRLELAAGKALLASNVGLGDAEGPSLSYRIAHPVSLASRRDQQMVRVMRTQLPSAFYHVATPVLGSYVYREAEVKNQGNDDLLAGPMTVYLDGRFVGRCEMPTVARGQTFVVGFGADPQLRARRELVERNEVVQGGNRELSFKYRLVLENFKSTDVPLRLFDRAPYSDRPAEVRIKLGEMKDPLSTDPLYVRTERPKNILRWDIDVPAGATGEKARLVEYGFTIEFDRNLTLGLPETTASGDKKGEESKELFGRQSNEPVGAAGPAAPAPSAKPSDALFMQFEQMQRAKSAR